MLELVSDCYGDGQRIPGGVNIWWYRRVTVCCQPPESNSSAIRFDNKLSSMLGTQTSACFSCNPQIRESLAAFPAGDCVGKSGTTRAADESSRFWVLGWTAKSTKHLMLQDQFLHEYMDLTRLVVLKEIYVTGLEKSIKLLGFSKSSGFVSEPQGSPLLFLYSQACL